MIFLLVLSTVISLWCGWANYLRAEKYKKQRNEYKNRLKMSDNRDINELAIMLHPPHGVFHPERQN